MTTVFPGTLDTFATAVDHLTVVAASDRNNVQDSILALEKYAHIVYNVKTYGGASGNGVTNDAPAINTTVTAAASTGGIVFFPPGTYLVGSTLSLSGDNIVLMGAGWGSVIKAASGLNADVITTPTVATSVRNNCVIRDLKIDGQRASQSSGSAIRLYGTRYCQVDRVWIINSKNYAILLDGDGTGFGYNNTVSNSVIDLSEGCVLNQFNESTMLFNNQFKEADSLYMVRLTSGFNLVTNNIFGSSGTYTTPTLQLENSGPSKIIGNRFDTVRHQAIKCNSGGQLIMGNAIGSPCSASSNTEPAIHIGANSNNVVVGNKVFVISGSATWNYAVSEDGGADSNTILGNDLTAGMTGVVRVVGTHSQAARNMGFNPQGVAAITVTASPFTYTNADGVDEVISIAGGTVSLVAKNSITLYSATNCSVLLAPGESVTVTYSSAPTMNKDRK